MCYCAFCATIKRSIFQLYSNPSRVRIFLADLSTLNDHCRHTHTHIHVRTHSHTYTYTHTHTHTQLREDLGYSREKKESTSTTSLKAMNVEDILNEV